MPYVRSFLTKLLPSTHRNRTAAQRRHLARTMPPKRAASQETQAETQACKRYRQAIDEVAEEYVCPITAELLIDPVTAEDGRRTLFGFFCGLEPPEAAVEPDGSGAKGNSGTGWPELPLELKLLIATYVFDTLWRERPRLPSDSRFDRAKGIWKFQRGAQRERALRCRAASKLFLFAGSVLWLGPETKGSGLAHLRTLTNTPAYIRGAATAVLRAFKGATGRLTADSYSEIYNCIYHIARDQPDGDARVCLCWDTLANDVAPMILAIGLPEEREARLLRLFNNIFRCLHTIQVDAPRGTVRGHVCGLLRGFTKEATPTVATKETTPTVAEVLEGSLAVLREPAG